MELRKKYTAISALFLTASLVFAQTPDILWMQIYGGSSHDFGGSAQQTPDGGFIVGGATSSFGPGPKAIYLVKTDAEGNLEWERTYGGSGFDEAGPIRQTSDGGYILGGNTDSFGAGGLDMYLVKTDATGNLQ